MGISTYDTGSFMTEVIVLLILTVLCLFIWIMLYFILNKFV